jgi:hypothetical protein
MEKLLGITPFPFSVFFNNRNSGGGGYSPDIMNTLIGCLILLNLIIVLWNLVAYICTDKVNKEWFLDWLFDDVNSFNRMITTVFILSLDGLILLIYIGYLIGKLL